jgi:GT2 family glycosyltransferase
VSTGPEPGTVTLVAVTWNSAETIGETLASFVDHAPETAEVVLVDNASHDDTVAAARDAVPPERLRVIANPDNRGLAAGNNQGIVAARGDWLLISNPDVVYTPGAVAALLACARRHPRAAFVIPRLLHPDGTQQTSAGDLPTLAEAVRGRAAQHHKRDTVTPGGQPAGYWWDGWPHDEERVIGHGAECAYLVRREAVAEVGLQDERFWLDWEGIDWAERVRANGWEIWLCPDAVVVHKGGVSIRKAPARWVVRSHVGMYRYFAKRHRPALRPLLAATFALRAAVKLAAVGVRGVDRVYDAAAQPDRGEG